MPQWLINVPCCMMEDGAISDSPLEPDTKASDTNLLPDWFPQRVEQVKRLITGRSTGPSHQFPVQGLPRLPASWAEVP
ncbi:unnamed protein product [Clonostachys chloroleuca]|uniref:Uncharacterized protein n=1 Tax=Clonostachys chloroleuca TaxID=1926264 RepID=A0AA35QBM1_9HYPO|nr:unnamed protein product [Clonostachys chloroleuca]